MAVDSNPADNKERPGSAASLKARKSPVNSSMADQRASPVKNELLESAAADRNVTSSPNDNKMGSSGSPVPPPRPASAAGSVVSAGRSTAINITNSQPNRPPSTTSVHSSNSATGAPRSTTTSRRGGRTRCRSPPTMVHRPGSTGPPPSDPYPPPPMDDRPPPSPANPSAAAAAAAAAAKSITRTPPPPSSWYDSPEGARDYGRRPHRGEGPPVSSRYPPQHMAREHRYGYEGGPPPPSSRWPPSEDGRPPSRSSRGDPRYASSRRGEDHYGYREGYYRGRSSRSEYPPYDEHMEYDRRYPEHPSHGSAYDDPHRPSRRGGERSTSPYGREDPYGRTSSRERLRPPREHREHHREHQREHPRDDPYYKKELEGSRAAAGAPSSVKRTTRVIGTATPIHMPRAPEPSRSSRGGSAASVFRGRPGSDLRAPSRSELDEESPQKILMALRTPSTSFEEKPAKRSDPLSPEAPPQIQHSHHASATDSNLFFEPQRSPKSQAGPPQPTSSIDMAPSFSLFNQSFDSIGDTAQFFNVGGPLDSALQSTSFGAGPSASLTDDKTTDLQLHPSSSGGNYTQQLLGSSGSGALTFGMSPSNSFGNGPPANRSGNMMILGGQDHRSASPSQVLDMYRSYSGGASPRSKAGNTLEDSHLRMSGTSLASPSIGNPSYNRSFGESQPNHFGGRGGPPPPGAEAEQPLGFYVFLRKHKDAFREVTFLLPGLKAALLEAPDVKKEAEAETPKRQTRPSDPYGEPNPQDIAIAMRRIACAVCAFGGTIMGDRSNSSQQKDGNAQSIFRGKPGDTATVTPSSSTSTSPGGRHLSRQRAKYDEILPSRYYENDNRLSWEFEENPPIDDSGKDDDDADSKKQDNSDDKSKNGTADGRSSRAGHDGDDNESQMSGAENGKKTPNSSSKEDQPKMRYRCKLCGQPKQNHTCPYQQSLARSIGTMIYPAVNAFTAAEPGVLAPALSEMNNFMVSGSESVSSAETSPSRPTPDRMRRMNHQGLPPGTAQVTPESLVRSTRGANSPISTGGTTTPQRARTPSSTRRGRNHGARFTPGSVSSSSSSRKKRTHAQMGGGGGGPGAPGGPGGARGGSEDQGELLFVESVELKPEQFRIVSQSKALTTEGAFTYAPLPLPYAQRKRLSDNLFSLSKEVPQLTDECATVLREAREKDLWDLAVAELMTQVVVVVHCNGTDSRFDGLRRYLLTLGISC